MVITCIKTLKYVMFLHHPLYFTEKNLRTHHMLCHRVRFRSKVVFWYHWQEETVIWYEMMFSNVHQRWRYYIKLMIHTSIFVEHWKTWSIMIFDHQNGIMLTLYANLSRNNIKLKMNGFSVCVSLDSHWNKTQYYSLM